MVQDQWARDTDRLSEAMFELQEALELFQGDRYKVARFLGLSPPSVYRKIKMYGIQEEKRYR